MSIPALHAQNTITTQPLTVTSICPGSVLDVSFMASGTYLSSNVFTVQLSNGSEYVNIPTGAASFSSASGLYTVSATIPPSTAAGTTYRLRVTATNPTVIGNPSSTSLWVKIKPGTPGVANHSICQQFCVSPATCSYLLSGTPTQGATIQWYNPAGHKYEAYDFSSANSITVYVYATGWSMGDNTIYASQTLNGCESDRVPFTATLNPNQPNGPTNYSADAYAVCQNSGTYTLDKFVGNPPAGFQIFYYDPAKGRSSGSTTAPVISTSIATTYTYSAAYISDKGCINRERNDGAIFAKVKPQPGKPSLSVANLSYCQNQTADLLVAGPTDASASLVWYGTDATGGTGSATAPQPVTSQPGTFRYYVAQSLNGCESERAEISIEVKAVPPPPPIVGSVTYCQNQTTAPLSATGTQLRWTLPDNQSTTDTPTPSAQTVGQVSYFVTQTGANGCESSRATIRVFVQGPPTLALSGPTTVNLGIDVPISLKFTGVGPYQYKILAGAGQSLSGSSVKDTTILVLPTRTTVYQVEEVSNRCGKGLPVTTATVVVTIPTIQTQALAANVLCAGSTLATNFLTTGQFNQGSVFKLQLARPEGDTTKILYADLPTVQVAGGQISATIPTTATAGTYLVRVMATNPKIPILGTPSATALTIRALPSAAVTASSTSIYEGEAVRLSVAFTGDGPWTFSYRDSSSVGNTVKEVVTTTNPYVLDLKPPKSTVYRLTALQNGCGTGLSLPASVAITVNPVLAVEPMAELIKVFPIPVTSTVTIQIDPSLMTGTATLVVVDEKGHTFMQQDTRLLSTQLNLSDQPAGLYLVQVRVGAHKVSRRVIRR